jgi:4-carboxymuconolactone decarboxylase
MKNLRFIPIFLVLLGSVFWVNAVEPEHESKRFSMGWKKLKEIDGEAGERVIAGLKCISPDLGRYIIEYVFGDVYPRPGLDLKSKEIAVVASLTALGNAVPQLKVHQNAALNVGCSILEVKEVILQMAIYSGFPSAINSMNALQEVLRERQKKGIKDPAGDPAPPFSEPKSGNRLDAGARRLSELNPQQIDLLNQGLGALSPDLVKYILEFAYGDVLSRPGLTLQQRQIATIAGLAAIGTAVSQLKFHIAGGLRAGLTSENIREIMILMSAYAGFPAAINGTTALQEVLSEQDEKK